MLHLILFQPEIPQNTGNVGRLAAFTRSRLHLVYPLGFEITDRHLKRAGMDYWKALDLHHHADWPSFLKSAAGPKRIWLFTTHATESLWNVRFADEDGLLFGREADGCPKELHDWAGDARRVQIPRFDHLLRSLNLSTAVGIATYEALRQIHHR